MWAEFIEWIESHMLSCSYVSTFGVECPGCGMQRAFVELLKGNFVESFKLFPALLPMIFLFVYLALHLKFKFEKGAKVLLITFIITVATMVISYIIKITN